MSAQLSPSSAALQWTAPLLATWDLREKRKRFTGPDGKAGAAPPSAARPGDAAGSVLLLGACGLSWESAQRLHARLVLLIAFGAANKAGLVKRGHLLCWRCFIKA